MVIMVEVSSILTITTMNYKKYIIDMILSMSKSHSKIELYTMSVLELVYLKDRLLEEVSGYLKISNKNYIN